MVLVAYASHFQAHIIQLATRYMFLDGRISTPSRYRALRAAMILDEIAHAPAYWTWIVKVGAGDYSHMTGCGGNFFAGSSLPSFHI